MFGKSQSAGTGNHWFHIQITQLTGTFFQQCGEGLLDIGKMTLIICKQDIACVVNNGNLNSGGTDIDS